MEDFVSFEIAKKLNGKGFTCKYPFAMYFRNRMYYDYDDFIGDKDAIIAPTISQVLKWLFDEKQLFVNIDCNICDKFGLFFTIYKKGEETWEACGFDDNYYNKPEEVTLAGIEYVLNNLI